MPVTAWRSCASAAPRDSHHRTNVTPRPTATELCCLLQQPVTQRRQFNDSFHSQTHNLTSRPLMNPTACRNELPKRSCAPLRFSSCYPRARHSAGPILAAAFCRVIATTDLWSHRDRQPRSPHTSKTTDHNATLFQRQLSHLFILASQCQPHRKASPFSGEEWQTRDYNQVSPR